MASRSFVSLYAHYSAHVDVDLIWRMYENCSGIRHLVDVDEAKWREEVARAMKQFDGYATIGQTYVAPELGFPADYRIGIRMTAKQTAGEEQLNGQSFSYPIFKQEPDRWFQARGGGPGVINADDPRHMKWFIEKARCPLKFLDVDYAFADLPKYAAKHMGLEPREMMWPLVYFPPDMMDRLGREKFQAVPAYSVEEDKELGGGVWVQATENPFTATKTDLKPLAQHFGLKVPR